MNLIPVPAKFPEGFSAGDTFLVASYDRSTGEFCNYFTLKLRHDGDRLYWIQDDLEEEYGDNAFRIYRLPVESWTYQFVKLEIPGALA